MKPFVIGRKNWLQRKEGRRCELRDVFAKTVIRNGLDVWSYMKWLISALPNKKKDSFAYSDYLP